MAIVVHEKHNVRKVGRFATGAFQIASTGQAFKILSDKMYSYKIRAVIRELSTNARDSHVAAKTMDTPFNVHLPTFTEPFFSIRDFGIGLCIQVFDTDPVEDADAEPIYEGSYSEVSDFLSGRDDSDDLFVLDEAMSLYTTYFHSNKIHSNDFVGQLGLGSKSPFAYTDSFEVNVYYHGEVRQYQCLIGPQGIPEINYIKNCTGPTSELSGLHVVIPVQQSDSNKFEVEAKLVYSYFDDIHPSVNLEGWVHPERQYTICGKDKSWGIRNGIAPSCVIMGNIAYPMDADAISAQLTDNERAVLRTPVEIKLPIGACEIAPSRERLGYKGNTIPAIVAKLKSIVGEMSDVVSSKLNDATSLWEARCLAYEVFYDYGSKLRELGQLANVKKLKWNNTDITNVSYIPINHINVTVTKFHSEDAYNWKQGGNVVRCKHSETNRITPYTAAQFYECDLKRGSKSRVMQHVRKNKLGHVYLVSFDNPAARTNFLLTIGADSGILKKTSDLPKCTYKKTGGTYNKASGQVFIHNGSRHNTRYYEFWTECDVELDDGGVYVAIKRYQADRDGSETDPSVIGNIIQYLKNVGLPVPNVIGVRPTSTKSFQKHPEWKTFWEWLTDTLKTACKQDNIEQQLADHKMLKRVDTTLTSLAKEFVTLNGEPSRFGVFAQRLNLMLLNHAKINNKANTWSSLLCELKDRKFETAQYDLEAEAQIVLKRYDVLDSYISNCYSHVELKSAAVKRLHHYINLVDNTKI